MPKLKIVIRPQKIHQNKDGLYDVKIRVTHQGKTRYIGTGIYVDKKQIDDKGNIIKHPNERDYNIKLRNILNLYDKKILNHPMNMNTVSMQALLRYLREIDIEGRENDFIRHAEKYKDNLFKNNRDNYAFSYESMIKAMKDFSKKGHIDFTEITPEWLQDFREFYLNKNRSLNTIAIYQRNIRVIFNDAIRKKLIPRDAYPFYEYQIKQSQTRKRSLDIEDIKKIRDIDLKKTNYIKARDLFMLSFYMNGMNFKDLLLAKKSDVYKGRLEFNRAKTGRSYSILIQPEAWEIINRYEGEKYLLRIIEYKKKVAKKDFRVPLYKNVVDYTNRLLKKIAIEAEINVSLSTYFARHSWATIASELGISIDTIAYGLGHKQDNTVTAIYVDFNLKKVDAANRLILDALKD